MMMDTDEILWEGLKNLKPQSLSFEDGLRWAKSLMRFIRKEGVEQYKREYCFALLDQTILCLQNYVEYGLGRGEKVSQRGKTEFFNTILLYSNLKEKFAKQSQTKAQKRRLNKRIKELNISEFN